jgi:hypothetical protein
VEADFRSKVDLWLIAVCVAIPIVVLEFFVEDTTVSDWSADVIAYGMVALVLLLFAGTYFTTRYRFSSEFLLIKSGPFSWTVPLRSITKVEPSHNPASGPALSLDRLAIHYDGKTILVSPADKQGFMAELKKRMRNQ